MKLVTILILLSLIAVGTLAFLGKQFNMDIIKIEAPKLPSFNSMDELGTSLTNTTTIHKWQDANGQWHFGNEVPDEVGHSQEIVIYTDQNIVQHYKTEAKQAEKSSASPEQSAEQALGMSPTLPSQMLLKLQQQSAQQALQEQLP